MLFFGFFKKMLDLNIPSCVTTDMFQDYFAKLYDRVARGNQYDLALYTQQAQIANGPILELGCGSGRVLIRLATQGHTITGVDSSKSMLSILEEKLLLQKKEIQDNVRHYNIDFKRLDIDQRFNLIIMPGLTLCGLKDEEELEEVFLRAYNHLSTGGRFIFDYSLYNEHSNLYDGSNEFKTFTWEEPDKTKEFFIIGEKISDDHSSIIMNCYAEVISGVKTSRYLGYSVKRIISTDDILNFIIERTKFKITDTRLFDGMESDRVKYVILQK